MALTETFSNSSIFLKICRILTPLQTLVYIIGFSTEHWVKTKISSSIDFGGSTGNFLQSKSSLQFTGVSSDQGLWKVETCFLNQCSTGDIPYVDGNIILINIHIQSCVLAVKTMHYSMQGLINLNASD